MTLTLEIAPETEAALQSEAARVGQSAQDYAARLFAEALEDALDIAECDRRMDATRPDERISWEVVKAENGL